MVGRFLLIYLRIYLGRKLLLETRWGAAVTFRRFYSLLTGLLLTCISTTGF